MPGGIDDTHPGAFSRRLLSWFDRHGRRYLPWSRSRDPYRIWVSEIMLQQTQVTTVIDYYRRFVARFTTVEQLAEADIDDVLHHWTGLGYYARARNMHKAARMVVQDHGGVFPADIEEVVQLPGIGRSTAGAILAFTHRQRHPILDGNVKRVLTRLHRIDGWPGKRAVEKRLWVLADRYTPEARVDDYTQAIMDLGAGVCLRRNPRCGACPVSGMCEAHRHGDQEAYPARAPRKVKPVKATGMLLIRNNRGELLLERRPPTGIWGGLWSLPECDADLPADRRDFGALGLVLETGSPREAIRHSFTHFHLDITPIPARVHDVHDAVMDNDRLVWYNLEQPRALGLAAPVKRLIETLNR
ncbi:MAG: A/G-specific adenine glycosylase [Gammaproteobacteria bacterium]|nr:A/G-specific adenine glycosylase [Gammaproteobacteria bacterium]